MSSNEQLLEMLRANTLKARTLSYSPYSQFKVGCCLLVRDPNGGGVSGHHDTVIKVLGANVENASYGNTICAERTAMLKAMTSEEHAAAARDPKNWLAIGIIGDNPEGFISPCGICRQFIREFLTPDTENDVPIYLFSHTADNYKTTNISELLPMSFGPDSL
ncbi:hypothetical protein TPHA_0D00670 [Tetrapisispora phaffii CBS 4417]|uniref:CMP/dCMP-type deaminase domain-containing protein n=1 Tax=Tetrapisispora phaffii (strain ATCC 24235 / CBS 4417 / NBRC 1672 / NRRL Y-8282 / UCD 70-5) TaxID=1071381 RepID=G8BS89_TETPH|nr:hypothetical protein TPHA_0D00670 [Tetrapisispora phaffii CBS 4417]CCE62710.1 hypothetical protein TPHA_0D00670 [Tetrapisispora phaffii CBS 4417]